MIWRVVLDSNGYLSGLLFKGVPSELLAMANHGGMHVLASQQILAEVESKLLGKFHRDPAIVRWEIEQIRALAEVIAPEVMIHQCRDPDDDRILECAIAGHADFIITGDKDLLTLNPYQNIFILTAREFLEGYATSTPSI